MVKQLLLQLRLRSVTLDTTQHMYGASDVNFTVQEDVYFMPVPQYSSLTVKILIVLFPSSPFSVCQGVSPPKFSVYSVSFPS